MEMHSYHVDVAWTTGRRGVLCSPELMTTEKHNCIEVATPPEFPGGISGIWSPEHLFAASIASCYMTTFLAIAEKARVEFSHFHCSSEAIMEEVAGRPSLTEVIIRPTIIIEKQYKERTLSVLHKTESACLISRAVRVLIAVIPTVKIQEYQTYGTN